MLTPTWSRQSLEQGLGIQHNFKVGQTQSQSQYTQAKEAAVRILSLDIGTKRIGVAISDPMGWTAQPLETVQVGRGKAWLERIATLCREYEVAEVVAGVPFEMNGKAGLSARSVRRVLAQVSERIEMDILEIDERLTSVQAERTLLEADMRRKQRKQVIDQLAAALILQLHLDTRRRA